MTTYYLKLGLISIFVILALALVSFRNAAVSAAVPAGPDDAAATYKTKCAMCHTASASKFFDPARTDEELTDSILKGKKSEKPPSMPAFAEKGITPEAAKELVTLMRQLKATPK